MQLIICEKPKVAGRIAMALSDGAFQEKAIYGVRYYLFRKDGKEVAVAPAVGHVYALKQKGKGKDYPVFDIEWAPAYEVSKKAEYTQKYISALVYLGKQADEYVNACDYDIEGSIIGMNVIRFACGSDKGRRMHFSALTSGDLKEAYEKMEDLDYRNAYAGEARHMLDWMWGINLSRALMAALRKAGTMRVMSIGRVQGPTLFILTDRERAIGKFVPRPYWVLAALCKGVNFVHAKKQFFDEEEAKEAKRRSKGEGIADVVEKEGFDQPPFPPFDLTSLQIEAYKHFGFSPAQTLSIAQDLYEKGMISYPRTASQKLPLKLGLQRIIKELSKNARYNLLADELIKKNRYKPHEGRKEDPAHPAIFPTGGAGNVDEAGEKVYDLIVKRFLSCFAEWAKRERNRVDVLFGTERYTASGIRTLEQGWFRFYSPYLKLEEVALPEFTKGEKVPAEKISIGKKETKPPSRYTQASLIETLEKKALGTKATRSEVIDTLYRRGYVADRSIRVTPFGLSVCSALEKGCPEILEEELTRKFERDMEQIRDGKVEKEKVIEEGKEALKKILGELKGKEGEMGKDLVVALKETEEKKNALGKCPSCGGELRMIRTQRGVFVGCSGYPECRNAYPLPQNALITPMGKTCEKCKTQIVKVIRKGKRPFTMCLDPNCETKKGWKKANSTSPSS
jgi:DNA topoisomerase-1